MTDVACGNATVLPEVGRMSMALEPLLKRTRHPKSGEVVRSGGVRERRERRPREGEEQPLNLSTWRAPALPSVAQPEATVMLEKGDRGWSGSHIVLRGRPGFCN